MLNYAQIENMKHCIGLDARKIKREKYEAFRNHFTTPDNDSSWDALVDLGYAVKTPLLHGVGRNPQMYRLTGEGLGFLSKLLMLKITEID